MRFFFLILLVSIIQPAFAAPAKKELPVFPGAEGYGTNTVAGSGRNVFPVFSAVYLVSNLSDHGEGSLRSCIEASGPRTCLFEVSGSILLNSVLTIKNPFITIAGQSAPTPGITLARAGIKIETHDVLIQHIAVRPGDEKVGEDPGERDGISVGNPKGDGAYNIVLDHLSLSWALDENLGTWYEQTHDLTVSNSIIAEGLNKSIHPKGEHSKGILIGDESKNVTIFRNVIAMNFERNPYLKPGSTVDVINNFVYGWGGHGGWAILNVSDSAKTNVAMNANIIGNYFKPGPESKNDPAVFAKQIANGSSLYVKDNIGPTRTTESQSEWDITNVDETPYRSLTPVRPVSVKKIIGARETSSSLLQSIGSRPAERDMVDSRIIREIQTNTGKIKDCLAGCPNAAGPRDVSAGKRTPLKTPKLLFADSDKDGYTNLENWLFEMARKIE